MNGSIVQTENNPMATGTIIAYAFWILVIAGTILVIISDEEADSGRKIAWILVVALLPAIGIIAYIVFGLNPRRNSKHETYSGMFREAFEKLADKDTCSKLFDENNRKSIREGYRELSALLSRSNGTVVTDNNSVEVITSGKRKFEALVNDLEQARDHIHMEYFYFRKDHGSKRIKEILMRKAREGVKVRFIHENIANITISPRYYNEMKKAGVEVVKFTRPRFSLLRFSAMLNYRDHRKIVVIDGRIGYTGGMNIGDDYFIRWRDTHMRITGNAVHALQYCFLYSFITSGGKIPENFHELFPEVAAVSSGNQLVQIVPDQPVGKWSILQMGATWTVQHARNYVYIQTPYFVPPEPLLQALKSSALKGADVRIMMPRKTDMIYMTLANKSYYRECLEAGVRIFEKNGNFIHSKTIVSDDYLSVIGSANMDYRSFQLDYEVNAYIFDEEMALRNKRIFQDDLEICEEISLDRWLRRPWYQKLGQAVVRLFAPLL